MTNFHEFEKAFPLLAMACKVCDYEGTANSEELFDVNIGTAGDQRFKEAEHELEKLTAPAFWNVTVAGPDERPDYAPTAHAVLWSIFA